MTFSSFGLNPSFLCFSPDVPAADNAVEDAIGTVETEGAGNTSAPNTSADPDLDVLARFPCLAISRSDEQMMDDAVLMLKVLWKSPPVPTISHYRILALAGAEMLLKGGLTVPSRRCTRLSSFQHASCF